jgi:uncharacterized membrane protein YvbJ
MKCPKCGTENTPGRVLCVKCGSRLRAVAGGSGSALATPEAAAALMQRLQADIRRLIVVFAIVVAVGLALGILLR